MAGSYNHIVSRKGNLLSNESFVEMIENLGDAYEMATELFGMIWFLADQCHGDEPSPEQVRETVEWARQNHERGLERAREVNRAAR